MQIGTCATGGPYVSARECPEGTTEKVLLIPAGFILGTVGILAALFIPMGLAAIWPRLGRRTRQWATSVPQMAPAAAAPARP